jgi:hypothetical protein
MVVASPLLYIMTSGPYWRSQSTDSSNLEITICRRRGRWDGETEQQLIVLDEVDVLVAVLDEVLVAEPVDDAVDVAVDDAVEEDVEDAVNEDVVDTEAVEEAVDDTEAVVDCVAATAKPRSSVPGRDTANDTMKKVISTHEHTAHARG